MATLILVPTPSALATSTGCRQPEGSKANMPLKAPIPPRTGLVKVEATVRLIRATARLPSSMSTPASA